MAKSRSTRGASHYPAFMVSSLTITQMRLPWGCSPGLWYWQWINREIWTLILAGSVMVMSLSSHRWSPGLAPHRCQSYSVLLPRKSPVQLMAEIMRLCIGYVGWLLQNGRDWGCGNGGAGVCGQTVEDGCDSLLMPVCGSVGGGENLCWSGMGYHGNIFLEANVEAGEAEIEGLI